MKIYCAGLFQIHSVKWISAIHDGMFYNSSGISARFLSKNLFVFSPRKRGRINLLCWSDPRRLLDRDDHAWDCS